MKATDLAKQGMAIVKQGRLAGLRDEIRQLIADAEGNARDAQDCMDSALWCAWQAGQKLTKAKGEVMHGDWQILLDEVKPEGRGREGWRKQAQLFMRVFSDNPDAKGIGDLEHGSLRAFRLSFVPPKERPEIEGDVRIGKSGGTALAIINRWSSLQQRIKEGLESVSEDELRRDLAPLWGDLWALYEGQAPPPKESFSN